VPIRKLSDMLPYLLTGSALMALIVLWLYWEHILDLESLSHLVD